MIISTCLGSEKSAMVVRDNFVRDDELESDNRSPLVLRSNPVATTFAFSAKLRKRDFRRLHPREDNACIIGAWYNSLDRSPP